MEILSVSLSKNESISQEEDKIIWAHHLLSQVVWNKQRKIEMELADWSYAHKVHRTFSHNIQLLHSTKLVIHMVHSCVHVGYRNNDAISLRNWIRFRYHKLHKMFGEKWCFHSEREKYGLNVISVNHTWQ